MATSIDINATDPDNSGKSDEQPGAMNSSSIDQRSAAAEVRSEGDPPGLSDLQQSLNKLKAAGLRLTPQRRAILACLLEKPGGHMTPQQVFNYLHPSVPSLSLATVYNTLEVLEEVGLITRITGGDGQTYFDATVEPHHHTCCEKCGRITDVFLAPEALNALLAATRTSEAERSQFQVNQARIWLTGVCRACQE